MGGPAGAVMLGWGGNGGQVGESSANAGTVVPRQKRIARVLRRTTRPASAACTPSPTSSILYGSVVCSGMGGQGWSETTPPMRAATAPSMGCLCRGAQGHPLSPPQSKKRQQHPNPNPHTLTKGLSFHWCPPVCRGWSTRLGLASPSCYDNMNIRSTVMRMNDVGGSGWRCIKFLSLQKLGGSCCK